MFLTMSEEEIINHISKYPLRQCVLCNFWEMEQMVRRLEYYVEQQFLQ